MRWTCLAALLSIGCGSSVVTDPSAGAGSSSGGTGNGGAATTSSAGGGGMSVTGTATGAGGSGGAQPTDPTCAGLDYCGCTANAGCTVISEDCFCPCGIEWCEPGCECDCGGGKYLGCAPKTINGPGVLEGLWLIGWSGGANHYSWVRIEPDFKLTVNDGAAISANLPYYPCNGAGQWMITAKPETVMLELPADCSWSSLTFSQWTGTPAWPAGCLQEVLVEDNTLSTWITACRFPLDQCDASLSSCSDPLLP